MYSERVVIGREGHFENNWRERERKDVLWYDALIIQFTLNRTVLKKLEGDLDFWSK